MSVSTLVRLVVHKGCLQRRGGVRFKCELVEGEVKGLANVRKLLFFCFVILVSFPGVLYG